MTDPNDNPMDHPDEQPSTHPGVPRFGRLLVILVSIVILMGLFALGAQSYFDQ